jgi:hypothetical protein
MEWAETVWTSTGAAEPGTNSRTQKSKNKCLGSRLHHLSSLGIDSVYKPKGNYQVIAYEEEKTFLTRIKLRISRERA